MQVTRENQVVIIGTLESNNLVKDKTKTTGQPYIRGNMVVRVTSPKAMSIPLTYFVAEKTKDGKPRKLYSQLDGLKQGQRINLTAQIQDNKFWDATRGQLVKTKRLSVAFINPVKADEQDKAEFVYSGFIAETLKEAHDKEGDLTHYTLKVAQSDYQNTRAEVITFIIDKNNTRAVSYIEREYTSSKTVKVSGVLDYDIRTETREEPQDFGAPIVKTYQRNISNLVITSGSAVTEGVYEKDDISALLRGDEDNDRVVEADAKSKETSGATASVNKPLSAASNTNQTLL